MNAPAKRGIVVGMDGASMELVSNMVQWGHMPNLARLMESGGHRPMIGETGLCPFALALTRQDAEMVNLWGDLVGDVVYALRPEFDGAHGKQLPTAELGIGGQHCTFVVAGAGVRAAGALQRQVRAVDVAPTLCYLLGVPMPREVEGGVVYEALEDPDWHLRT